MNKNGVTLVELLVVIAIIGLLAVMISPGIMSIRNSVLESTLKSRESQIENAAKDYAYDHINIIPSDISTNPNDRNCPPLSEDDIKNETYRGIEYKCCATVSVNYLINSGYLVGTNSYDGSEDAKKENQIINPVTGESMNNRIVCIRYSSRDAMNRELIAYLLED